MQKHFNIGNYLGFSAIPAAFWKSKDNFTEKNPSSASFAAFAAIAETVAFGARRAEAAFTDDLTDDLLEKVAEVIPS